MPYSLYPHFDGDPIEQSYKYVDAIIKVAPELGQFKLEDMIKKSELSKLDKDIAKYISGSIRIVMKEYLKYVEPIHPNWIPLHLTDKGREVRDKLLYPDLDLDLIKATNFSNSEPNQKAIATTQNSFWQKTLKSTGKFVLNMTWQTVINIIASLIAAYILAKFVLFQ